MPVNNSNTPPDALKHGGYQSAPPIVSRLLGLAMALGAIFLLFAIARSAITDLQPFFWQRSNCHILSSGFESIKKRGKNKQSEPRVKFEFTVNGKLYTSSRIMPEGTVNYDAVLRQLPHTDEYLSGFKPNSVVACYINQQEPSESVLIRRAPWYVFFAFIPLIVGVLGWCLLNDSKENRITSITRRIRPRVLKRPGKQVNFATNIITKEVQEHTFRSQSNRRANCFGATIGAVLWNGIIAMVIIKHSPMPLSLSLFLIPFFIIGLLIIYAAVHAWGALANPELELTVQLPLTLGQESTLGLRVFGNRSRMGTLKISLVGREEVQFKRGKNKGRRTRTFCVADLAEVAAPYLTMENVSVQFSVPQFLLPSFEASNNQIRWYLRAHSAINNWSDVDDQYPITIVAAAS